MAAQMATVGKVAPKDHRSGNPRCRQRLGRFSSEGHRFEVGALDSRDSVFAKLEPRTERVNAAADLARATTEPPENTRAWLRAKLVERFGVEVAAVSWSRLTARDPNAVDAGEATEFYGNAGHMAAPDHHLFSLDISDPLAYGKARCEAKLNAAEHAIDLLKALAINGER